MYMLSFRGYYQFSRWSYQFTLSAVVYEKQRFSTFSLIMDNVSVLCILFFVIPLLIYCISFWSSFAFLKLLLKWRPVHKFITF